MITTTPCLHCTSPVHEFPFPDPATGRDTGYIHTATGQYECRDMDGDLTGTLAEPDPNAVPEPVHDPDPGPYRGLRASALEMLREHGMNPDEWITRYGVDGEWVGDVCGCPDDRCIGHHHDETDECSCLAALLFTEVPR